MDFILEKMFFSDIIAVYLIRIFYEKLLEIYYFVYTVLLYLMTLIHRVI